MGVPAIFPDREGNPQSQLWTPSAVYLSNTEALPVAPFNEAELPAYLVNADASVERAYKSLNGVHDLFGTAASHVVEGFDRTSILKGYEAVLQRTISHWNATQTEIYEIADYEGDGTTVTNDAPVINGAPLE
ncbi:hypothetical protein J7E68_14875 [Microbacterium sp. ISL-103]|uniref:hypothetical protein n=1 Tax=Microbacterium sp. ISL-103 TaxID=2819156 RepID=UPI001BE5DB7D|nr:hypothetical protein [Microbacterium sp. ISL-103]MBT2475821.1 hypothetical protein [Microbacterium sp. ISL-103]